MKAIVSTTPDDKYLFFLPIINFLWGKLGVDTICFSPKRMGLKEILSVKYCQCNLEVYGFSCPEHKEATYTQCSRLYAASLPTLDKKEILITSDIDMALFQIPSLGVDVNNLMVVGHDLVPDKQYPMCYTFGSVGDWRNIIGEGTYQEHLDKLLGGIESNHFRGNYWSKDQEELYKLLQGHNHYKIPRSNGQNQFAQRRVDRDDSYWEDRLNYDVIDAHLWRPGYADENFPKIIKLIKFFYPNDDLTWLENYRNEYLKLI